MKKRSYLLTQAKDVSPVPFQSSWRFDDALQLNTTINEQKEVIPVCIMSSVGTGSKTAAAPGDDDPDPDAEYCY